MYWKKEGAFLRENQVNIFVYDGDIREEYIIFENDTEFANEDEFYSAFKKYPY